MGFDLLRGRVLALVILMTISSCAQGMQSLVFPLYLRSIGVPPAVIGLILGTSGLALIIFEFAWGWWSDRVGIGVPLIISRSGLSLMLLGYSLVQAVPGFFVLQFASGAFSCATGPLSWAFLGHMTDPRRRGEAIALAQIPGPIGLGIGALAGGFLVESVGYRHVFMIAAAVAAAAAVVAAITFRSVGAYQHSSQTSTGTRRSVASTTWLVPLAAISTVTTLTWFGTSGERGLLPILAQMRGLRANDIGLLFTVLSTLTAILLVPVARFSNRVGRKPVILVGLIVGALALAAYSVASGVTSLLAIVCLRAVASASTVPVAITVLSVVTPPAVRGRVMGLYGSFEDVGIAIGPAVSGFVWSKWGIDAAFLAMASVYATSFVAAWVLIHEARWLKAVPAMVTKTV